MENFTKEEQIQQSIRLKNFRHQTGMSVEEFSERIGISVSGYQKVENGQNAISKKMLRSIRREFYGSADYFLFGDEGSISSIVTEIGKCKDYEKMWILMYLVKYFAIKPNQNLEIGDWEMYLKIKEFIK